MRQPLDSSSAITVLVNHQGKTTGHVPVSEVVRLGWLRILSNVCFTHSSISRDIYKTLIWCKEKTICKCIYSDSGLLKYIFTVGTRRHQVYQRESSEAELCSTASSAYPNPKLGCADFENRSFRSNSRSCKTNDKWKLLMENAKLLCSGEKFIMFS